MHQRAPWIPSSCTVLGGLNRRWRFLLLRLRRVLHSSFISWIKIFFLFNCSSGARTRIGYAWRDLSYRAKNISNYDKYRIGGDHRLRRTVYFNDTIISELLDLFLLNPTIVYRMTINPMELAVFGISYSSHRVVGCFLRFGKLDQPLL